MRRSITAQAEIDAAKKTAILDAALEMFSTEGFGGTRVESIAKKAGVSYGTVYHYYPTKEVLYHMVVQRAMDESFRMAQQLSESKETAYEQMNCYLHDSFNQSTTSEGAQGLQLLYDVLSAKNIPEITRAYAKEKQQQITHMLTELMLRLQQEGHLVDKDPEEMVSMIHALKIGHTFLHIAKMCKPLTIETILSLLY